MTRARSARCSARSHGGGRWVVPPVVTVNIVGGELTLDFREAILSDRHTVLQAHLAGGTLRVFVPDGVTVTVDGTMGFGRQKGASASNVPPPLDGPLIEVRALALLGEILVKDPAEAAPLDPRHAPSAPALVGVPTSEA